MEGRTEGKSARSQGFQWSGQVQHGWDRLIEMMPATKHRSYTSAAPSCTPEKALSFLGFSSNPPLGIHEYYICLGDRWQVHFSPSPSQLSSLLSNHPSLFPIPKLRTCVLLISIARSLA